MKRTMKRRGKRKGQGQGEKRRSEPQPKAGRVFAPRRWMAQLWLLQAPSRTKKRTRGWGRRRREAEGARRPREQLGPRSSRVVVEEEERGMEARAKGTKRLEAPGGDEVGAGPDRREAGAVEQKRTTKKRR